MKNRSLFVKSMVLIIVPVLAVSIILILVTNGVILRYFREESFASLYRELETAEVTLSMGEASTDDIPSRPAMPKPGMHNSRIAARLVPDKSVQSRLVIRVEDNQFVVLGADATIDQFELDQIIDNEDWPYEGETVLESETVFYAIAPMTDVESLESYGLTEEDEIYYIAYISESYSSDLSRVVMKVFIIGLVVLLAIVSCILFYVFKHMTGRIRALEQGSSAIGKGEFGTRLATEPYDEIGRLGEAMNHMSIQLEMNQDVQADHFQMISHELKTPIMVMQGYLDALIHGQFPSGSRDATYKVLEEELNKLGVMTQDIVLLNKLDYLSKNNVEMMDLSLKPMFLEEAERINVDRSVAITVEGDMTLVGDQESWRHVIENVLTNHLRYAGTLITVELQEDAIRIWNDGPAIEEHLLPKIKQPFIKGKSGRSGLGLAIVSNILKLYHFDMEIRNCDNGVAYFIRRMV